MFTCYQRSLVTFYDARRHKFIDWIASQNDEKMIIIVDFWEYIVGFLDTELRRELRQSPTRNDAVLDMLIELHTTKPGTVFQKAMANAVRMSITGEGETPDGWPL